jgi:hypothetical protein
MNTCKTCKWWNNNPLGNEIPNTWGYCDELERISGDIPPVDGLLAIYADAILTGPDFGCVHHQEKETT